MTPAEELAAAADKLDARLAHVTAGPWDVYGNEAGITAIIGGVDREFGVIEDADISQDDAHYIAGMDPLVGKALAAVLRQWAKMIRLDPAFLRRVGGEETLAVARLINGTTS